MKLERGFAASGGTQFPQHVEDGTSCGRVDGDVAGS